MSLINSNLLTEEVKELNKIIQKRAGKSALKSLIKRPSISVIRSMMKMLEEHKSMVASGNLDPTNYSYFPKEKTQKKYLKLVRKLFVDIYTPFNKESEDIPQTTIESKKLGDVPVDWVVPFNPDRSKAILHIHGGGYVVGNPEIYHAFAAKLAVLTNIQVIVPDYRLAPENKFPDGLFDCVEVYQEILNSGIKSENVIITGDSAGGGMTLALMLYLRDQGIPLPGGAIPISPYADLTFKSETLLTNMSKDIIIADFPMYFFANSYINQNEVSFEFPLVSPVYGDYTSLPEMLIVVSKDEALYGDSLRIAEKARSEGVNVTLFEKSNMPHVFPCLATTSGWEEVEECFEVMQKFILRKLYSRTEEKSIRMTVKY